MIKNFYCCKMFVNKNSGFTLIELLVAVAVFTLVVIAMVDIFLMSNNGLARIFSQQNVQDSARFMMESMTKDLRMSLVDDCSDPCRSLKIKSYLDDAVNGEDITYTFDAVGGNLTLTRGNRAAQILNSNKVSATGYFIINKTGLSPRVTIVMKVRGAETKVSQRGEIQLQTTISSRRY